ncbi:hypothetical protein LJC53_01950 [Bacteroidales bacterium OttesenSCG-928-C03]|nr:hypothetical protein [Bacteroidales bacterium OttesenSCG-928-C03]MDL2326340.1 hypothetical protein [Bacteroidales bacterium OttesenSCG-928-A14]
MIKAIHINSTKPFRMREERVPYFIYNFDILCTVLSALMWRKHNGPIKLYTDKIAYDYYDSLNLLDLWDGGIDTTVVEHIPDTINQEIFWAAAKLFALQNEPTPVTMIDTDLIVWENIESELVAHQFAVLHREELFEHIYLPDFFLKKRKGYQFDPEWDWKEPACCTAFAYFSNPDFKQYYLDCAIDFMTDNNEYPKEMVSQMVFAEQRIATMCAKKMNVPVFHFLEDPFQKDNTLFTHLWGGKDIARNDSQQCGMLCDALFNKIKEHSPEYYKKLKSLKMFS